MFCFPKIMSQSVLVRPPGVRTSAAMGLTFGMFGFIVDIFGTWSSISLTSQGTSRQAHAKARIPFRMVSQHCASFRHLSNNRQTKDITAKPKHNQTHPHQHPLKRNISFMYFSSWPPVPLTPHETGTEQQLPLDMFFVIQGTGPKGIPSKTLFFSREAHERTLSAVTRILFLSLASLLSPEYTPINRI